MGGCGHADARSARHQQTVVRYPEVGAKLALIMLCKRLGLAYERPIRCSMNVGRMKDRGTQNIQFFVEGPYLTGSCPAGIIR